MKLLNILFFSLVIVSICVSGFAGERKAESAPDFQLSDLNGNMISLSSYKGKQPVVVFFWTTWCPYCRAQLKVLNDRYPALAKNGWEILAINIDDPEEDVRRIAKENNLKFKVVLDGDSTVAEDYDIFGVPAYFIVDKEGKISDSGTEMSSSLLNKMVKNNG